MKYFFNPNNEARKSAHRLRAQRPAFVELNCLTILYGFSIFIGITKALECWGDGKQEGRSSPYSTHFSGAIFYCTFRLFNFS